MADAAPKRNFIAGAIKRPGRETRRAKRAGVSVLEQEHRDARSPNKSLAAAGRLGLTLRTIAHGRKG